jgi:hypothetical protein
MLHHTPHNVEEASGRVPEKVMAIVLWDVHQALLADFTPPGSTVNAAACQETKGTQGGYLVQETRIGDQMISSFSRQCSISQCCHNHESLELLELGNSSTSTIQS